MYLFFRRGVRKYFPTISKGMTNLVCCGMGKMGGGFVGFNPFRPLSYKSKDEVAEMIQMFPPERPAFFRPCNQSIKLKTCLALEKKI